MQRLFIIALVLILGAGIAATTPVRAGSPQITSTADSGPGSLRDAIAAAAPGAFLAFDESLTGQTITLASGIVIDKKLSISGPSGKTKIEMGVDGNAFTIDGDVTLSDLELDGQASGSRKGIQHNSGHLVLLRMIITNFRDSPTGGAALRSEDGTTGRIADSTISFNSADGAGAIRNGGQPLELERVSLIGNSTDGNGGAIHNDGQLNLLDVTIFKNGASENGGGIDNNEDMEIRNSAIYGNSASGNGGGIYTDVGGVHMYNVTISGNSAAAGGGYFHGGNGQASLSHVTISRNQGGGIRFESSAFLDLDNSIVADQTTGADCSAVAGPFTSEQHNLDSDGSCPFTSSTDIQNGNAMLAELALNAPGTTQTHELLAGSDAIDQIPEADGCGFEVPTDQRGVSRPQGSLCDIGAYEAAIAVTRVWGDVNCSGAVDARDILPPLIEFAGIDVEPPDDCPALNATVQVGALSVAWSNVNCDGTSGNQDALDIALFAGQVPMEQTVTGCPDIGESVEVTG